MARSARWRRRSRPAITNCSVTATGGYSVWAIYNEFGSVTIRNTTTQSSGATSPALAGNVGLGNRGTAAVTDSQFTVPLNGNSIAVSSSGNSASSVRADGCQLTGAYTVWIENGSQAFFGATRFDGGVPTGQNPLKCASSYNGSYVPTDASCQW